MTKAQALKYSLAYFSENCLKIKDKNSNIVPLVFNSSQKRLDNLILEAEKIGQPVFVLILKARQIGFSTFAEAKIFHRTVTNKNTNALIVAHEDQASTNLFSMSKMFYDFLPEPMKPSLKASNAKELIFDNQYGTGLRSKIVIQSARNVSASRSGTYNIIHISEIDFWQNPDEAMTAILQTVPMTPNTLVIIESTANGFGGYLHRLWEASKQGKNAYIPFFVAWFDHEEYQLKPPIDFELFTNHTVFGDEKKLKEMYKLNNEQVYWRRWTIENKCNNDINIFKQEYPSNDIEAFLTSGRARFSTETLIEYRENPLKPILSGQIVQLPNKEYKIVSGGKKEIEIYEKMKPRGQYLIDADVAEGLEHGDYSCAKVIDMETMRQVAEWHGHIEHANYGKVLVSLGRIYNNAVLAIEANNHGHSVITQILNENYPERQIFVGSYLSPSGDDDFKNPLKRYGWQTTVKTKRIIIDNLAYLISKKAIEAFNDNDISELLSYVIDEQGRTNAMQGSFDDRVMTLAIGYYLLTNEKFRLGYMAKQEIINDSWLSCRNCKHLNGLLCQKSDRVVDMTGICAIYKIKEDSYR
jgi:hypothetical protein